MNLSVALLRAVADQAKKYAHAESIPHCLSYGDAPAVCFFPYEGDSRHGNFLDRSYKAIQANPEWRKRLTKVHTLGKGSLPVTERGRWMELDTCMSSDALLMNMRFWTLSLARRRFSDTGPASLSQTVDLTARKLTRELGTC